MSEDKAAPQKQLEVPGSDTGDADNSPQPLQPVPPTQPPAKEGAAPASAGKASLSIGQKMLCKWDEASNDAVVGLVNAIEKKNEVEEKLDKNASHVVGALAEAQEEDKKAQEGAAGGSAVELKEEKRNVEKAPTLQYLSTLEVFNKGNHFTREVQDRKTKVFPRGTAPTNEWIMEQMTHEWLHADGDDTKEPWGYCTGPVPQEKEKRLDEWGLERDKGNEGMTLEDFQKRPAAAKARLELHEVLALRLYTGPGYKALNTSLRKIEMRFAVTARVISITIVKLVEGCGAPPRCFRGMSLDLSEEYKTYYRKMTDEMLASTQKKKKEEKKGGLFGGVTSMAKKVATEVAETTQHTLELAQGFAGTVPLDPAPLSFTTKQDVVKAFTYGKETGITLCFAEKALCKKDEPLLKIGMGAQIDWVSQYPTEGEVLFPPFTAMLPYALEHRDLTKQPQLNDTTMRDIAEVCATAKQYCFFPVMFCSWSTQWDNRDGAEQNAKWRARKESLGKVPTPTSENA